MSNTSQYNIVVAKASSGFFKGSSGNGANNGSLNGSGIFDQNLMSSGGGSVNMKRGKTMQNISKETSMGN